MDRGARPRPYDPKQVAEKMAPHGYKHVELERRFEGRDNQKYGLELNIKSEKDFSDHIESTIRHPETKVFKAANNRDIYYNERTNTVVIVNISHPERGTCYRDKNQRGEFERLKDRDDRVCSREGLEPAPILEGGYEALYSELESVVQQEASYEMAPAAAASSTAETPSLSPDEQRQAELDAMRAEMEALDHDDRDPGHEWDR